MRLTELNRFLTSEEVRKEYRVPDSIADEVLASLPVVLVQADGSRIHLESEVNQFLSEYSQRRRQSSSMANPLKTHRIGRKVETLEIALYADQLKRSGCTWKEILKACRQQWPESKYCSNAEQIRATWKRHCRKSD